MNATAQLRELTSALVERMAWATGYTFGGQRNVDNALGYKKTLDIGDYRLRYDRNEIAGRVIDAKPESTWRGEAELIENPDSDKLTTFEQAFFDLDLRLNIWASFLQTDKDAGLGRYAVLLIGAPGSLETPLTRVNADQIVYLESFAEDEALLNEAEWDTDLASKRFGKPKFYNIKRTSINAIGTIAKKVHWSRVIHVAEGGKIYGKPRLERIWNRLDDLVKVVGGGSEAFWLRANPGRQFDVDPAVPVNEENKKKMEEQIDEFQHGMRRELLTRGLKISQLGADVANFEPQVKSILTLISGGTGIPLRILTGSEMGELASTQDRSNWAERIKDRRTQFASPYVVRPFVDRLIELGALPRPKQYIVRWPEVGNLTDLERAQKAESWGRLKQTTGVWVVSPNEIRDHCLGLSADPELDEVPVQDEEPAVDDELPRRPVDDVDDEEDEEQQRAAREALDATTH